MRVGDDKCRARIGLGLAQGGHSLSILSAERHPRHVDVAILHRHEREVLLGHALAAGGEFRDRTERGGLGGLPASIGIDLRIKHQDLDVGPGGQHVVEAAVADIISPAVSAHNPDGFFHQIISQRQQSRGVSTTAATEGLAQCHHPGALGRDAGLRGLIRGEQFLHQLVADARGEPRDHFTGGAVALLNRQMDAKPELGVVLEQ